MAEENYWAGAGFWHMCNLEEQDKEAYDPEDLEHPFGLTLNDDGEWVEVEEDDEEEE